MSTVERQKSWWSAVVAVAVLAQAECLAQLNDSYKVSAYDRPAPINGAGRPGPVEPSQLGLSACSWPAESGKRLLDRQLGALSFTDAPVAEIVRRLVDERSIPLSFIEAEQPTKISVQANAISVGQLLDLIVARNDAYRYRWVGSRLVLFPTDPTWEMRLKDLIIAPGPRMWVSENLVLELRRRVPLLAKMGAPSALGNPESFLYQDEVTVPTTGTILEFLTHLLGNRASAVFTVTKTETHRRLGLGSADLVRSLHLTAPATTLRIKDAAQLSLMGTLRDGTRQDLTKSECGTVYSVTDKRVLRVSATGVVTAIGTGEADVIAINENVTTDLLFRVSPYERGVG